MRLLALRTLILEERKPEQSIAQFVLMKEQLLASRLKGTIDAKEVLLLSVLSNVGKNYDNLVLPMLAEDTVTLQDVKGVLEEAQNREKLEPREGDDAHVHYTGNVPNVRKTDTKVNVTCFRCGKYGHLSSQCWSRGTSQGSGEKGNDKEKGKGII